jgi:hypothetical protein
MLAARRRSRTRPLDPSASVNFTQRIIQSSQSGHSHSGSNPALCIVPVQFPMADALLFRSQRFESAS